MNTSSYLKLSRHNIYIFRRRIPKALLDFFSTNELRISTKTSDKKSALHIARSIANESDLLFEQLAKNKNMEDKKDFTELSKTLERWRETNYLKTRIEEEFDLRLQETIANNRKIRELETTHRSSLKEREEGYKLALDAVSASMSEKFNNSANPAKIDFKLSELVEDFLSVKSILRRNDKPATVRKDNDSLKRFISLVGDKQISKVTQIDALEFAEKIPTYGLINKTRAVNTISGYLCSVSKFSGWVATFHSGTGHKKLNFSKLGYKKTISDSDEEKKIADKDVKAIFTHSKFIEFKNDNDPKFWLITIAAYTGMRLEEITQLNPFDDIYKDENDIWVIDINEKDNKNLKTKSSPRIVPIHSKLLEHGLIAYIEKIKLNKATRLFPETTIRDGRTGKNVGKTTNYFIQKIVGIKGKGNHSFRHTIGNKLKRANVEISIATQILGHAFGGIHPCRNVYIFWLQVLYLQRKMDKEISRQFYL